MHGKTIEEEITYIYNPRIQQQWGLDDLTTLKSFTLLMLGPAKKFAGLGCEYARALSVLLELLREGCLFFSERWLVLHLVCLGWVGNEL